jgi:hypothetical protein
MQNNTPILNEVMQQLYEICKVMARYKAANGKVSIDDILSKAFTWPVIDSIVGDKDSRDVFIASVDDNLDTALKVIYSRVTTLSYPEVAKVITDELTAFSGKFYNDGNSSEITRFYKDYPHYLILRLMEQFTVDQLIGIGAVGVTQ